MKILPILSGTALVAGSIALHDAINPRPTTHKNPFPTYRATDFLEDVRSITQYATEPFDRASPLALGIGAGSLIILYGLVTKKGEQ